MRAHSCVSANIGCQLTLQHSLCHLHSVATKWTTKFEQLSPELRKFLPKSFQLGTPVPDFAFGLSIRTASEFALRSTAPFHSMWEEHKLVNVFVLLYLEEHPVTRLHARPAKEVLVYPCFVQEVEHQLVCLRVATNKLVRSLVFAFDQQEELRRLAGAPVEERLPIFGAVSSGADVRFYCAAYVGEHVMSLESRSGLYAPNLLTVLSSCHSKSST